MTIDVTMPEGSRESDYSDETSTFGDRLALAREAVELSQAQLAQRMGVRAQTMRNWEEDRSEPRASTLHLLAGVLNVSMRWLLTGHGVTPEGPVQDSDAREILADVRNMRAAQRRLSDQMARLEQRLLNVVK